MIPIRRIVAEKRRVLLPLVVTLLLNVIVYAAVVYPIKLRSSGAEARLQAAEQQLAYARREERAARALAEGKQRAADELQRFYKQVLPANMAGARRITFLRLADLAGQSGLRYGQRQMDEAHPRDSSLTEYRMSIVLEGGYQNIRRFIHRLETAPEFVVIEQMGLAEGDTTNAPLALTLTLSTYYRKPSDGT